jgi:L-aspartate oxidase
MEMLQFDPTVYVENNLERKMLLSEALRGEGAYVVDENGNRFLFDYDKKGELAPRDIVSRAIFDYTQNKNKKVFLNFDNFSKDFLKIRFPNIYKKFSSLGFDLPTDNIPISPAFHYCMGGIKVDLDSKVEGFDNLYAVGEVASTMVHGANRLASNSLLEGLVFSKRAIMHSYNNQIKIESKKIESQSFVLYAKQDLKYEKILKTTMWKYAGIVRQDTLLLKALEIINDILNKYQEESIGYFLYLKAKVAKHIVISAIKRTESIGAHYKIES